jgi:uncharacterized protein (DUF2132 family)
MKTQKPKDPLEGKTLETILKELHARYGWETLGQLIDINCFNNDPSLNSSLKFLRRVPWARKKVEMLYLRHLEDTEEDTGEGSDEDAQSDGT